MVVCLIWITPIVVGLWLITLALSKVILIPTIASTVVLIFTPIAIIILLIVLLIVLLRRAVVVTLVIIVVIEVIVVIRPETAIVTIIWWLPIDVLIVVVPIELVRLGLNIAPLLQVVILLSWLMAVIFEIVWSTSMGDRIIYFIILFRLLFFVFWLRLYFVIAISTGTSRILTKKIEFVKMEIRCTCCIDPLICFMPLCIDTR